MRYQVRLRVPLMVKVYHIGKMIAEPGTLFLFDKSRQPHDLKYTFLYWGPHKVTLKTTRFNQHNFELVGDTHEESVRHVGFGPRPDGPALGAEHGRGVPVDLGGSHSVDQHESQPDPG